MQLKAEQICWVPVGDIVEPEDLREPAEQREGALLLACREDGLYELLAGKDRLQTVRAKGQGFVAAIISPTDSLEKRLSRLNDMLFRGNLHYLEEAELYRSFIREDGLSPRELSQRTGRSVATIRKKIRLLSLGDEICGLLRQYDLREGVGEALLRMPGQQGRLRVLGHVVEKGLGPKETDTLVEDVLARMPVPITGGRRMRPMIRDYRLYLNAVRDIVEQMRDAGLDATMKVTVGRAAADVRISVPLFSAKKE